HVEKDGRSSLLRRGSQANQGKSVVVDRRISEQPLDVGLTECRDGAEENRGKSCKDHNLSPGVCRRREPFNAKPRCKKHCSSLRSGAEEHGYGCRRSFVDVGSPHVERHSAGLEGQTRKYEHEPEQQPE